jgi:fatty-acyl-CoA synthase
MREMKTFAADFVLGAQIEARGLDPEVGAWPLVRTDTETWTYRRYRDECVATAHFLLRRLENRQGEGAPRVAMFLENHPELLSLFGGCACAGATLFGMNTGLRGATLAGVLNQSGAELLVVDQRLEAEVVKIQNQLEHLSPENILTLATGEGGLAFADYGASIRTEVGEGAALPLPDVAVEPETPLMIIYTSGTTGLPKGINNNHAKLLLIGMAVSQNLELTPEDVGYACMPLFHSNAMFLGFMPTFTMGGSIALRERFSASKFVPDILRHGVTYWNYVGEPVHYVLGALDSTYPDAADLKRYVTDNPGNRLRMALGNGAAAPDIERFDAAFGLDDVLELSGSTEAAISTFRRKGDPRGSVGEITDEFVRILDERDEECPPADVSTDGKIQNYAASVGEICRVAPDTSLFQGYFDNDSADAQKYRDGVYHSGDLGHVLVRDGRRHLFFDGRTDDWIRKDGENFSALQVARLIQENADVVLAAAYGVPCAVSDELVMVALKMRQGVIFDPAVFFDSCEKQVVEGGMDRKWFPDFIRIVSEFEYTQTEKILVRNLKKAHFAPERTGSDAVYWRTRGDQAYRSFAAEDFLALREIFVRAERVESLDR